MVEIEKIKISEEEGNILYSLMRKKKISQRELSKKINMKDSYLNGVLKGRRPLYLEKARQIYEILGRDSSVIFLINYDPKKESVRDSLDNLYYKYSSALNSIYESRTPESKFNIVSELERLVQKYQIGT